MDDDPPGFRGLKYPRPYRVGETVPNAVLLKCNNFSNCHYVRPSRDILLKLGVLIKIIKIRIPFPTHALTCTLEEISKLRSGVGISK